jgi:hypothetical protein
MDKLETRVLGRVLAVEEVNDVSGGWTLASAGDTSKSQDTGAYTVDTTSSIWDIIISPGSRSSGG